MTKETAVTIRLVRSSRGTYKLLVGGKEWVGGLSTASREAMRAQLGAGVAMATDAIVVALLDGEAH